MDTAARIAACDLPDLSETWARRPAPTVVMTPMVPVWLFLAVLWGGCGLLGAAVLWVA